MSRIRPKKKKEIPETPERTDFLPYAIIFLLLLQTVFLAYKNSDYIRDIFRNDPNAGYETPENSTASAAGDIAGIDPSRIRVSVLNGCGESGLAGEWKEKLRNLKYDVRETGNASGRHNNTKILSRTEDMRYARHLAASLGISEENVMMQVNKDLVDIDVTLIVGADHKRIGN